METKEGPLLAEETQSKQYVPMKERVAFYFSSFLRDMSYAVWGNLTRFYIDVLGFVGNKWGWINAALPVIERVYDGINDPLIGAYYDGRKYGAEKARPFFRTTAFPVAGALILAFLSFNFSVNEKTNMLLRAALALLAYMVYEGFQTLNATAHMSLYNSITPNINERAGIVSRVRLFAAGGTGLVGGLTPVLLDLVEPNDIAGKKLIFAGVAGFAALTYLVYNYIMYNQVHERTIVPPEEKQALLPILRNLFRNKPFLIMMIANAVGGLLNSGNTGTYFYEYNLGRPSLQTFIGLTGIPAYIISAYLTPWLCKRLEKRTVYLASSAAQLLISVLYLLTGYKSRYHWKVILNTVLGSIPGSVKGTLYWNMVSDSVDYVEWKTGERNDGMTFAVEGLTNKLVGAFGQVSTAMIIKYTGFVPNALSQKPATLQGLFRLPLLIGIASTLGSAIPYLFYDFRRKDQEIAVAEIQERKAMNQAREDA